MDTQDVLTQPIRALHNCMSQNELMYFLFLMWFILLLTNDEKQIISKQHGKTSSKFYYNTTKYSNIFTFTNRLKLHINIFLLKFSMARNIVQIIR